MSRTGVGLGDVGKHLLEQQSEHYQQQYRDNLDEERRKELLLESVVAKTAESDLFHEALNEFELSSSVSSIAKIAKIQEAQEAAMLEQLEIEGNNWASNCKLKISLPNRDTVKLDIEQPNPGEMVIALEVNKVLGDLIEKVDVAQLLAEASDIVEGEITLIITKK